MSLTEFVFSGFSVFGGSCWVAGSVVCGVVFATGRVELVVCVGVSVAAVGVVVCGSVGAGAMGCCVSAGVGVSGLGAGSAFRVVAIDISALNMIFNAFIIMF